MEDKQLYIIQVKGRVQGVGFKWSAANEARALNITGFVRNLSDGSVYLEAEGRRSDIDAFVEWCKTGPAFGYVEDIEVVKGEIKNYKEFSILR